MTRDFKVITLAQYRARKRVQEQLRASGRRPQSVPMPEIRALANEYLRQHWTEIAEATEMEWQIAWTVARQYRKRARQLVVLSQETEHSPNDKQAERRENADDRRSTNHTQPNTTATPAQLGLSAAGVPDGE